MKAFIFPIFLSIFLSISLSTLLSAHAQEPHLKDFAVATPNFSMELELVVENLSKSKHVTLERAQEVAAAASLINNDLKKIPRSNALFLIKSEIYKGLLNNQHISKNDKVLLSEPLVKSVEQKLEKHGIVYGAFSKWIMESIISDLSSYRSDGFLNRYQTVSRSDLKQKARAMKLEKLSKYLAPWIILFNEKTPEEFEEISTFLAMDIVKKLSKKTFYLKQFSSKHSEESFGELFTVPVIESPEQKEAGLPSSSLKEESEAKKKESQAVLDTLSNKELESPDQAIDQLIKKEAPVQDSEAWTPE